MNRSIVIGSTVLVAAGLTSSALAGDWIEFNNETSSRIVAPSNLVVSDNEEKDYAWGDVDNDGDIDLVIVRKQPFTSEGKRTNVLLMNEGVADGHDMNGVLVDRTEEYATASTVAGDQGFLTPTNDRDVQLIDVDLDGWLDIVTATTLSDGDPAHIKLPRVYMNLGENNGVWQGFRYEADRVEDFTPSGSPSAAPRFCSVGAGDLTGDGYPDFYFGDYDSGGGQIHDFNNRVLVNDGNGFFTDETTTVLPTFQMRNSAFGAASVIADMNNDGVNDVVKQTALNPPQHVAVTYNDENNVGVMEDYDIVNSAAPYFVSAGDLNNDGLLDLVVVDDFSDVVQINQGIGPDGAANFSSQTLPQSGGFGGNSLIVDLNDDGWNDVIVADVDVDIFGCDRDTNIYRNTGGSNPNFIRDVGNIPNSMLFGVHDVAVFDINGDGTQDMIIGRCNSTEVWVQPPQFALEFNYPQGLPTGVIEPDLSNTFTVELEGVGSGVPEQGSAELFVSIDGGPFEAGSLTSLGGNTYEAELPALDCGQTLEYYIQADLTNGSTFTDPAGAPNLTFELGAFQTSVAVEDNIENDTAGWTIQSENLTSGAWEQADPNGTVVGTTVAAPDSDNTVDGTQAFVTMNTPAGSSATVGDVDGGPTYLISPVINLDGASDAIIEYARWVFINNEDPGDRLVVSVSNDGGKTWTTVEQVGTTTSGGQTAWEQGSFNVADHVSPTANVQVRFAIADQPNDSITEAGIDDFVVTEIGCEDVCTGDLNNSGAVDVADLLELLGTWGACDGECPADFDQSGTVDVADLLTLLGAWGSC